MRKKCFLPPEAPLEENVRGLSLDESDISQFGDQVNLFYVQFVKRIESVTRSNYINQNFDSCDLCMFEICQYIFFLVNCHHLFVELSFTCGSNTSATQETDELSTINTSLLSWRHWICSPHFLVDYICALHIAELLRFSNLKVLLFVHAVAKKKK